MRNFIKTIYEQREDQTLAKLQIENLTHYFGASGDEVECYLSSLIYKGFIKGYIIHSNCIMFSK